MPSFRLAPPQLRVRHAVGPVDVLKGLNICEIRGLRRCKGKPCSPQVSNSALPPGAQQTVLRSGAGDAVGRRCSGQAGWLRQHLLLGSCEQQYHP